MKRHSKILFSLLCTLSVGAYFFLSNVSVDAPAEAEVVENQRQLQPDVALVKHFFHNAKMLRDALRRAQ